MLAGLLIAQLALPVLAFPEPTLDDAAAYRGYQTRFLRDAARNTHQVYLDEREGRIVHLLANAENESVGLSVRAPDGSSPPLRWGSPGAVAAGAARRRTLRYTLEAGTSSVSLGRFFLGSMRFERDIQYWRFHRAPLDSAPYIPDEWTRLTAALNLAPPQIRASHLGLLRARTRADLESRFLPAVTERSTRAAWEVRLVQPTLDGRDTLELAITIDPRQVEGRLEGRAIHLRSRSGSTVRFDVSVATTGRALTPLDRRQIFTTAFLAFVDSARASGSTEGRWLERQVRGVELLASREKLMAGLPTYATYFGRDMLVSALMMRPVWRPEMAEYVIAAALGKLSARGEVSHEEALGGQAAREAAAAYAELATQASIATTPHAESLWSRAGAVLATARRVRENYHMIDDELQLQVLVARWIDDPRLSPAHKRAFLARPIAGGGTMLDRLMQSMSVVATMTEPYATAPVIPNLISFRPRDQGGWHSASWRDSGAGYAGGRFAMDVNAIWAPAALESMGRTLASLRRLGFSPARLERSSTVADSPLAEWLRDSRALDTARDTWTRASTHFSVTADANQWQQAVEARIAVLPVAERSYWSRPGQAPDLAAAIRFPALALDGTGRPLPVMSTDPATRLFLEATAEHPGAAVSEEALTDVADFLRPYPRGLLVDRVGPVVANDVLASPGVWDAFERDRYHSPRVAWGREVNLYLIGVASASERLMAAGDSTRARALAAAARRLAATVDSAGFRSELWSYEITPDGPRAVRYGSGADVQLWSTTDLVVRYRLAGLRRVDGRGTSRR